MSRLIRLFAALAALLALAPAQATPDRGGLTVMSLNIRYPAPGDGVNQWEQRRDLTIATIRAAAPDLIGTQELFQRQGNELVARLPEYGWFGTDRRGGHADEHMGVFYRRDRLKIIEIGEFWLSDTPAVPGSISWGHPLPRMVTWATFETRAGRRFRFYNTHFPYRAEDEPAREKAAALIAARIAAGPADLPVILTGDFNTGPGSRPHAILSETLADAWTAAGARSGPDFTFHGFTGRGDRRIDWIFTRGFTVDTARTIDTRRGPRFPSDHFPVVARLRFRP